MHTFILSVRKPVRLVGLAILLALLVGTCASNVVDAKPSQAPAAWIYGGHCYRFVPWNVSWSDAKDTAPSLRSEDGLCAGMSGYLAVVNSAGENTFIRGLGDGVIWLGGTDAETEGEWRWESIPGKPIFCIFAGGNCPARPGFYTNWEIGKPDSIGIENHLSMNTNGTWNDLGIRGEVSGYVVEYEPAPKEVPEGETLLLLGGGIGGLTTWLRFQGLRRRKVI